jgi:hypothetical protein
MQAKIQGHRKRHCDAGSRKTAEKDQKTIDPGRNILHEAGLKNSMIAPSGPKKKTKTRARS